MIASDSHGAVVHESPGARRSHSGVGGSHRCRSQPTAAPAARTDNRDRDDPARRGPATLGLRGHPLRLPPPRSADHLLESARIDRTGTRAVLVNSNGNAALWDLDVAASWPSCATTRSARSRPRSRRTVCSPRSTSAALYDCATRGPDRSCASWPGHRAGPVRSPSRRTAGSSPRRAVARQRLGGARAGQPGRAHRPRDQTRRIDYLGDGATAVTGSRDGDLRVWDTASGRELRHIGGAHAGRVQWVAGSPDGGRIASTGDDALAKTWDAHNGRFDPYARGSRRAGARRGVAGRRRAGDGRRRRDNPGLVARRRASMRHGAAGPARCSA